MKLLSTMLAALLLTAFAGTATAQGEALFAKTHRGAKESKVASDWYDKLPKYIHSRTVKNDFPKTHLPYEVDKDRLKPMRSGVNKFEIRDANDREFSAFFMAPDGVDGAGMTRYVTTEKSGWVQWRAWPAKYIVETYPVESNTDVADLVAFAAWLYAEKENNLANRVLTVAHRNDRSGDFGPLIEGYICEKEKWDLPPEGLVEWGVWDIEYQTERVMLVTPAARDEMKTAREKEAERAFKELVAARGDYRGRPPRRRGPTRSLARLDWDFRQFEIAYKNTEFLKETKTQEVMQEIKDSIKNDIGLLNDNKKQAREMPTKDDDEQREKAEFLEQILQIDPMDIALRADVAAAWYLWADVDAHGNSAARVQGLKNAIPHYEEVLKIYPFSTAFLLRMGQCYQAQEDSKKARVYFEAVIDIAGTKGDAVTAKALIRNMEIKDSTRAKKGR
jgi:tetratricopeptide (TPR) repeat protein